MERLGSMDLFSLKGKTFVVAGGAHHLGNDMASALADAGADGVVTSRRESDAQSAAKEISQATGRRILGMALDATQEDDVKRVLDHAAGTFGRIDILINCVGGGGGAKGASTFLEDRPRQAWDSLHEVNLTAPFLLCKHVTPIMRRQGEGAIINIASVAGMVGRDRRVYPQGMSPQAIDYASAKAAVIGMTRDMAAYLGPARIRVNAISPGGFERGQPPDFIAAYSDKCPLKRMGKDGVDLKGAAIFLASPASAYVTGHNLVVDGGFTIWQ